MRATRCQFASAACSPFVLVVIVACSLLAGSRSAGAAVGDAPPESNRCAQAPAPVALGSAQWNGWGRDLDNTRYQPEPAIRATDVPKLALKWAYGFPGSVVAGQPTIVDGRLFVASAIGRVYALDAKTGCTYWTFDAASGVRSTISIGELGVVRKIIEPKRAKHKLAHVEVIKAPSAAIFGDDKGAIYSIDAQRGTLLWKTVVGSAPGARIVAAPALFHERVYVTVLGGETGGVGAGDTSVAALDLASGRVVWTSALGAGVAVPPTIDAKRNWLFVATSPNKSAEAGEVAALDLSDGRIRWTKKLSASEPAGTAGITAALVLRSLPSGKQLLLAAQRSGAVYALDSERGGDFVWESKVGDVSGAALLSGAAAAAGATMTAGAIAVGTSGMAGPGGGGVDYGLAADYRSVFVALSGLASDPQTPVGSLTALDMKTGTRRWHTAAPGQACSWGPQSCLHAQAQAVTVMPGIVLSGGMDGHLRAYSTINGKIVWDFDTAKDYATVNGIKASGGSLDQGGPTIVNGIVYLNSGYALRPGQPGNVLLAFSVDGK